jgi:chaperonin GroEL
MTGDALVGVNIVRKALDEPARWIAENAGLEGRVAVNRARELGKTDGARVGLNAATGEYGDLVAQGVVDPVKVTRSAVRNAASISNITATTETLIADKPEEEAAHAAAGGHGHAH